MQSQDDRVNVEQLALEISDKLTLADNCREQWEKNDGDDAMRLTIAATLNKIGFQDIGLPGVRPHILKMVEQGEIQVFSTFNKLPPVGNCDISASMGSWCMSQEDAAKVRDYLLPGKRETHGNNSTAPSGTPDDDGEQPDALRPTDDDREALAKLFDPVKVATLEALFPEGGKWSGYVERAARNGLSGARVGRGKFNPYLAAVWWISQGPHGWKWERCLRVLANNLPARSRDAKHLLTGDD